MCYVLTFQDWKGQRFYLYDDDFDHLIAIALNDRVIQESGSIRIGSKNKPPIAGHLPYEVYLNNLQERKRRQENGLLAEKCFKRAAIAQKFIAEEIPQDKDSIAHYKVIDSLPVKRADFNIKNCKNIEVDVKCLTFYPVNAPLYFYISSYEIDKLENLNALTGKKTILAIYHQADIDSGHCPVVMIKLSKIRKNKKSVIYDKDKDCYKVPLSLTTKGFKLLESYRIKGYLYGKPNK